LELACLALLRAAVALARESWAVAEPEWAGFADRAAQLPDALLQRFVPPFRALFEAASDTSPLARRFVGARRALTTARWRVRALGAFECEIDGHAIDLSPLHLNVLEQFAQAGERESPDRAIQYYQHILQIDGCREQTAAQLMRLARRIGNRSLVSATFEHLTGALRTVDATPQPSTTALYASRDA
jgi:hypothetical protein